jgi:hypothetical protein
MKVEKFRINGLRITTTKYGFSYGTRTWLQVFFIFYIEKIKYCQIDEFFVEKNFAKRNLIFKLFSIRIHHIKTQYVTFES